jgi:hypothetical protein
MFHVVFLLKYHPDLVWIMKVTCDSFRKAVTEVLLNTIGPHSHSGRPSSIESPYADRTPLTPYTTVVQQRFEKKIYKSRIVEILVRSGNEWWNLTIQGTGFYRVVSRETRNAQGDKECMKSQYPTQMPQQTDLPSVRSESDTLFEIGTYWRRP